MDHKNDEATYAARTIWSVFHDNEEYMVFLLASFIRREHKLRQVEKITQQD